MTPRPRKDKGHVRKVTPEEFLEALNSAKPHFHHQRVNKRAFYRFCVEKGLLIQTASPRPPSTASFAITNSLLPMTSMTRNASPSV